MRYGLIGFQGVGKTTQGQKLASTINLPFFDLDTCLTSHFSASSNRELFVQLGEPLFRQKEKEMASRLMPQDGVLAFGGGALLAIEHAVLHNTCCIYLHCPYQQLYERVAERVARGDVPVWLQKNELLECFNQVWEVRHAHFLRCARFCVEVVVGDIHKTFSALMKEIGRGQ